MDELVQSQMAMCNNVRKNKMGLAGGKNARSWVVGVED